MPVGRCVRCCKTSGSDQFTRGVARQVIFGTSDSSPYLVLDTETGKQIVGGGTVYFGSTDGNMYALE